MYLYTVFKLYVSRDVQFALRNKRALHLSKK